MNITRHFSKRVKERLGLSKKLSRQFFIKSLKCGLYIEDFESYNKCYTYLKHLLYDNNVYNLVVYNRYIIIYAKKFNTAITILNIPCEYNNVIDSIKLSRKENDKNDKRTDR